MRGERRAADEPLAEPSWLTARSEADTASRRLAQAATSLERLSRELANLQEWGDTTARLEVAHALIEGPDGGVLALLSTAAATPTADGLLRRTAELLLARLEDSLGLEPVAERGQHLRLRPDELAEFQVRGSLGAAPGADRVLCRVIRPGWCLGPHIVARPLVEPVAEEPTRQEVRDALGSGHGTPPGCTTRPSSSKDVA